MDEPIKPDPDDCCGDGCYVCVWDRYYDQMDSYYQYKQNKENKK